MNLYKFIHKLLLKNDAQLKQKSGKKKTNKKNHQNLLKKKNHAKEKSKK